jgi:hypothetical protein
MAEQKRVLLRSVQVLLTQAAAYSLKPAQQLGILLMAVS